MLFKPPHECKKKRNFLVPDFFALDPELALAEKTVFVLPAKQKYMYICIAFPVLSSSVASAASALVFVEFLRLGHFLRNYKGYSHETWVMHTSG